MRIALLSAVALAGLSLASCTTTTASIDTAIQKNLPAVCGAAGTAHLAFVTVAETGSIAARTVSREAAAFAALEPLCREPSRATTASVLVAAVAAYATITTALREAERKT